MKTLIAFICFLYVTSNVLVAQEINWKEYQEPSGTFNRLSVSPWINFSRSETSSDLFSVTNLEMYHVYLLRKLDDLKIINLTIDSDTDYTTSTEVDPARFFHANTVNLEATKYLNRRRGLFIEGRMWTRLAFNRVNFSDELRKTFHVSPELRIGFGRLENIGTLYRSLRFNRTLMNSQLEQPQIFDFARMLQSLSYNNRLDFRMRNIENGTLFLEYLEEMGHNLDTYQDITSALDFYNYEIANTQLESGYLFSVGIKNDRELIESFSDYDLVFNAVYALAINPLFHFRSAIFSDYNFDEFFRIFSNTRLSYLPSARTSFIIGYSYDLRSSSSLQYSRLGPFINGEYFISPMASLSARLSYSTHIGDQGSIQNLNTSWSGNFRFVYYFI